MTIARKLWAGFGVLILVFVVAGLVIFFSQRSVTSAVEEITRIEEPTRAAAYEMQTNALEISRDVLQYMDRGDSQYRDQFAEDRSNFEESKASYDELVDT